MRCPCEKCERDFILGIYRTPAEVAEIHRKSDLYWRRFVISWMAVTSLILIAMVLL